MALTTTTISGPTPIVDRQSVDHGPGKQVDWALVPTSEQDAEGNKRIDAYKAMSMRGNGKVSPRIHTKFTIPAGGLTRSGSTATVDQGAAHSYVTGDIVTIAGADQSEYNGDHTITVTGANTYTFSVTGTPATPATGTITSHIKAYSLLASNANENSKTDAISGYGMIKAGSFWQNLLPDGAEADIATIITELQTQGDFRFYTYADDRLS